MTFKGFIIGLVASFGLPWLFAMVIPFAKMRHLDLVEYEGVDVDGAEGVYLPKRDGRITEGSKIYGQEGCYFCHTQLIRPTYAGSDIWRKDWAGLAKTADNPDTRRETIAFDYQDEKIAHTGMVRVGPDLSNFGRRISSNLQLGGITAEEWLFHHLYNPRIKTGYRSNDQAIHAKSVCPPKPSLFKTVDAAQARSGFLDVECEEGKAIIPTDRARTLASYLLSLKKDTLNQPLPKSLNYAPAQPKAN